MMKRHLTAAACLLALTLAACNKADPTYQGWIEANLIFVAPD
jgi:predicted small secreted protein